MTPQETEALKNFLQQLVAAQVGSKDPDAEQQIQLAHARQPDALYLLVQRAMIQDQALAQAQMQIASLQAEVQRLRESGKSSFLSGGWGNSSRVSAGHSSLNQGFSQAQTYPAPNSWSAAAPASGGSSWLGTMAATAGGGAAGAAALRPRPVRQCRTAGPARLRDAPGRAVARAGVARGAVALARGPGHGGGLSAFHGIVTTAQYRLR